MRISDVFVVKNSWFLKIIETPDSDDVLIFSGNHLHGSVINNSGLTRFSSEIRTVDIYDVKNNIGAKNIDGYPHGYHLEWFHSVRDDGKKGMNLKKLVWYF